MEDKLIPNNPAARLYNILTSVIHCKDNLRLIDAWAETFGVSKTAIHEIIYRISLVMGLAEYTKARIRKLNIEHDLYLSWEPEVNRFFLEWSLNGSIVAQVRKTLPQDVLVKIRFCSSVLSKDVPEKH